MDDLKKEKLKRFSDDKVMNTAVREVVEDSILNRKGVKDVYILAAERIAIDILKEAWKELDKFGSEKEEEERKNATPHV